MTTSERSITRLPRPAAAVLAAVAGLLLFAVWSAGDGGAQAARQAEVAARGAPVMGFDPDATVHRFTDTETGGVQEVVARDPGDAEEVAAVRTHLFEEADAFAAGDYSSPTEIHGADMPGLAALSAAPPGTVEVEYSEIDAGAQLVFSTDRRDLVDALHAWFDAQLADHGADAEAGSTHDQHQGG